VDLSVFFAGTAGSVPTARRGLPAVLLRAGGDRILFDCGEGTQQQLLRSVGLPELDAIFLTHLHLDHWLGLVGMLKTFDLRGRERRLTVYGPTGLRRLMEMLRPIVGRTSYPLDIVDLSRHADVDFGEFAISSFPVIHRGEAYGYAFVERDRPGRFDVETARALGIAEGPDFGRLQRGEVVGGVHPEQVVGEARAGRRIVLSGDTAPCQAVEGFAQDADLLIHEATFLEAERERARDTLHTTARQAAEIGRDAGVRMLALTHLSTRYFPREVRDEAREVFPNTVVPRDFDAIAVPFRERGEPELIKPEREPEAPPVAPAAP
jgi:ribonuclease Z